MAFRKMCNDWVRKYYKQGTRKHLLQPEHHGSPHLESAALPGLSGTGNLIMYEYRGLQPKVSCTLTVSWWASVLGHPMSLSAFDLQGHIYTRILYGGLHPRGIGKQIAQNGWYAIPTSTAYLGLRWHTPSPHTHLQGLVDEIDQSLLNIQNIAQVMA